LFDRGFDVYFNEKLGSDWLSILRAEHKALSHGKETAIWGVPANHSISFKCKENGSYVFELESFYDCPSDPGTLKKTIKVEEVGSVIKDEVPEQKASSHLGRLGKWLYENF
jgi:hypothetical protein